ncbi:N-acetylmuramoyl-L-alanine amidase, partial [Leptolyngbya cf. ectocarpi LEGE 11479]
TPPSGNPLPRPGLPAPGNNTNVDYQVIVPGGSAILRSRVNSVEPGAFRTTVNGQTVIQAGRFREQARANELRQRLIQAGLSAQIVETEQVSLPTRPTTPSGDIVYQVIVPGSSAVVRSRVNSIESGAFRTTVDGQAVIQAGRFREQSRANNLQRRLKDAGLDARIVQTTGVPTPTPSPTTPTTPARRGEVLVMIDPGHGGRDPGAVGNGLQEKEINLFISRRVQRTLEQRGYRVALTRNSDIEVDLQPRVNIAERANATVFVSIHANAISLSRPEVNGLETYYFSSGRSLAQSIQRSILSSTDLRDRGVRQARFYVLRNTSMPAVLVETGFITGREDSARFRSNAAREQIADAIAQGIIDYLR